MGLKPAEVFFAVAAEDGKRLWSPSLAVSLDLETVYHEGQFTPLDDDWHQRVGQCRAPGLIYWVKEKGLDELQVDDLLSLLPAERKDFSSHVLEHLGHKSPHVKDWRPGEEAVKKFLAVRVIVLQMMKSIICVMCYVLLMFFSLQEQSDEPDVAAPAPEEFQEGERPLRPRDQEQTQREFEGGNVVGLKAAGLGPSQEGPRKAVSGEQLGGPVPKVGRGHQPTKKKSPPEGEDGGVEPPRAPKRGRGRPRKTPCPVEGEDGGVEQPQAPQRGRGRPRKTPCPVEGEDGGGPLTQGIQMLQQHLSLPMATLISSGI